MEILKIVQKLRQWKYQYLDFIEILRNFRNFKQKIQKKKLLKKIDPNKKNWEQFQEMIKQSITHQNYVIENHTCRT